MRIAIIGAGNVGTAVATAATRAGHEVVISARHPEHAEAAAVAAGAQPATDNAAAVSGADVIILAVPYGAAAGVAAQIAPHVAGRAVVDASNPLTPDFSGLATAATSAAEEMQARLPGASVVKALNTVFASRLADPGPEVDGYVAGDDQAAKERVMDLLGSMGYSPLDVGPLSAARALEGMAFLNIRLNMANDWSWSSAWHLAR